MRMDRRNDPRENSHKEIQETLLYLCVFIGCGSIIRCLIKNVVFGDITIPYSAGLLVFGIIFGGLSFVFSSVMCYCEFILHLESVELKAIIFPSLLFKTAFHMDVHIFQKSLGQILTISTLGFVFTSVVVGFFITYLFGSNFSLNSAIIYGIIVSVIDARHVNKLLGQFNNIGVMLAGEELVAGSLGVLLTDFIIRIENKPDKFGIGTFLLQAIPVSLVAGFINGKLFICFVSWDKCDLCTNICFSIFISYTTFYCVEKYLEGSGILALLIFGIIISYNKRWITAELEQSLIHFWDLLYNIICLVFYIEAGVLMVHTCAFRGQGSDIVLVFLTYVLCLIARFSMFLLLSPVLARIGYGINWKNGIVLVWGALKGTGNIVLAFRVHLELIEFRDVSDKIIIHVVGLILLQLLINGTTVKKLVKFLGFMAVSAIKITNMYNIILYVLAARDRAVNMLRMNRFFADASWETVREATKIIHPYKEVTAEEGDFTVLEEQSFRFTKCPECQQDIYIRPTQKELQKIKKEIYLRILKAKKVSYWRQYEWGLMSKEANRTLVGAVNDALEKNRNSIDVNQLKTTWKPRGCTVYARDIFVKMMPKNNTEIKDSKPLQSWHNYFHKVVFSIWWECVVFFVITLTIISIILDFVCTWRKGHTSQTMLLLITFSTCIAVIVFVHTLFEFLALGVYNFIKSFWHFLDVITIALSIVYLFYAYKHYLYHRIGKEAHVMFLTLSMCRVIFVLRFLRIATVVRLMIPKIVEHLDGKIDVHLAHGFDVGKGFITGENEVIKLLPRFIGDPNILSEIKDEMDADRLEITKEIGILQRNRPTLALTLKTREAMAAVLYAMKETTKELKDGGLLDDEEYLILTKAIYDRRKFIRKRYWNISLQSPDEQLRQVAWLVGEDKIADLLIEHSLMLNLNYEEILIRPDEEPQGIYVLVSGLVKTRYHPNRKKLEKLEKYGALPNLDYPTDTNYDEAQEDYIVSGNVIGEIGILTGRSHDAKITCESSVQAFFISVDVMNYVKSMSGSNFGLEQKIWKAVSIRLACIILPAVPMYQSWSQERIQIHLERGFVPKLDCTKTFHIGDVMESVILIEGRAFDIVNKEVYVAPSYIPRTVRKLSLSKINSGYDFHVEPIILVIPAEDVEEIQVMDFILAGKDAPSGNVTKCLFHGVNANVQQQERAQRRTKNNTFGLGLDILRPNGFKGIRARPMREGSVGSMSDSRQELSALNKRSEEEKGFDRKLRRKDSPRTSIPFVDAHKKVIAQQIIKDKKTLRESEEQKQFISRRKDSDILELESRDTIGFPGLSYFNYQPPYDLNFDGLSEDSSGYNGSSYDTNQKSQVAEKRNKFRLWRRRKKAKKGAKRLDPESGENEEGDELSRTGPENEDYDPSNEKSN